MDVCPATNSYKLKKIRYQNRDVRILMQNENGPCPLIAAANCLLLKDIVDLPVPCKLANCAKLDDVVNMLAEYAIAAHNSTTGSSSSHTSFYIEEVMEYLPKFQYGMDVNPKLTSIEFEYTAELTAFESLNAGRLLHGWLVDPQAEVFDIIGNDGYNQVMDRILHGQIDNPQTPEEVRRVHEAQLMKEFLESASHQLTNYGLSKVWESITDNQVCVLFRNNHYATILKHDGELFLLATDFGYAESPAIVWEKLDMVDGDTEFYDWNFHKHVVPPSDDLDSGDVDYQLALHMSLHESDPNGNVAVGVPVGIPGQQREAADRMLALQLQGPMPASVSQPPPPSAPIENPQEATDRLLAIQLQGEAPPSDYNDYDSLQLARQLQREENQNQRPQPVAVPSSSSSSRSNCTIM